MAPPTEELKPVVKVGVKIISSTKKGALNSNSVMKKIWDVNTISSSSKLFILGIKFVIYINMIKSEAEIRYMLLVFFTQLILTISKCDIQE
tara:strand:- start:510 stop:782 length:273 start_codon:yes stop_codon:yes gene_type:complete